MVKAGKPMTENTLNYRFGGLALIVGYVLVLGSLLASGLLGESTITNSGRQIALFLLPPLIGICSGLYVRFEYPYRTVIGFISGSYLGITGIALTMLRTGETIVTSLLGLVVLGLATLALVGILRSSITAVLPETSLE
jgi:hypothetical protein